MNAPALEETEGRKDLVLWLESPALEGEAKRTPTRLARMLGISQPAVNAWVTGRSRPEIGPLRDALCRIIGSHSDRWMTVSEREKAERLASVGRNDTESPGDAA